MGRDEDELGDRFEASMQLIADLRKSQAEAFEVIETLKREIKR